jgi:hypothetical protein
VPEQLAHYAGRRELIAHDCALTGNPSHSGVDDLDRDYDAQLRARMILYHYGSAADGAALAARGYRVAQRGERVVLPSPDTNAHADPAVAQPAALVI